MPRKDIFQRYLDAGYAVTEMTRDRAESIVREFVKAGEVRRDNVQSRVDDLVDRSRRNTEQLLGVIRSEITSQFSQLGLATKDDLKALETRLAQKLAARSSPSAQKGPVKKVASASQTASGTSVRATKAPANKATASKATANKVTPTKTAAPTKAPPGKAPAAANTSSPAKAPAAKKAKTPAKKVSPAKTTAAGGAGSEQA
jgi:polyhydroxyalkanoate synthesis regulator phasin